MARLQVTCLAIFMLTLFHGIPSQETCSLLDVCFVVDASGSIGQDNWNKVLQFLIRTADLLNVGPYAAQVGLVKFSTNAYLIFNMSTHGNRNSLNSAISSLPWAGGWTNTPAALSVTRTTCFSPNRTVAFDVVVIITDGIPTKPVEDTVRNHVAQNKALALREARKLKGLGVKVYVVGITQNIDRPFLEQLSSEPHELNRNYFVTNDFDSLRNVRVENLIRDACNSSGPDIQLPPPTCYGSPADVLFIVDSSGSLGYKNFKKVMSFVSAVAMEMALEPAPGQSEGLLQMGLLLFSDNVVKVFGLNDYHTRLDVTEQIKRVNYVGGTTNLADALKTAREGTFEPGAGDRAGAWNIIVLVTDGESNNKKDTMREAGLAHAAGITIIVVSVGSWLDVYELQTVASYPLSQNYININNANGFDPLIVRIRDAVCNNNDECRSNPCMQSASCRDEPQYYWCQCPSQKSGVNCQSECRKSSDVIIALDASGSIGAENFEKVTAFVRSIVLGLGLDNAGDASGRTGTRLGLVTFADNVVLQFHLNSHLSKVSALNAMSVHFCGGVTYIDAAIRYAQTSMFTRQNGDRPGAPNYLLLITDGRATNHTAAVIEATKARAAGTTILTLGVGDSVSMSQLRDISSSPADKTAMEVTNYDQLPSKVDDICGGLCNNINECSSSPCQNGATCTDRAYGFTCSPCPEGYTGYFCERASDGVVDLAFIVDSSGSIRHERFPEVLQFVQSIVKKLDVHVNRTRVALLYFSDSAEIAFYLDTYTSRENVMTSVGSIPFLGGRTNMVAVIRMLRTQVMISARGARDKAQKIVIIITDGNSNINQEETIPEAVRAHMAGIYVIVVAIGTNVDGSELNGIASCPESRNIIFLQRIAELPEKVPTTVSTMTNDVDECSSNPCQAGGRCVDLLHRYWCLCKPDFTGYNCERRCTRQLDVAFLLDLSGSLSSESDMVVKMAKEVIYGLDTNLGRVRVAVLAYSDRILGQTALNTYTDKMDMVEAMKFYQRSGKTDTRMALNVMTTQIFGSGTSGDRAVIPNVGILLSDGFSNIQSYNTIPVADTAKKNQINIYTVGIGENPNMGELTGIASKPSSEYVLQLRNAAEIQATANRLLSRLCV